MASTIECPNCKAPAECTDSVDIGIGSIDFEWGCDSCGALIRIHPEHGGTQWIIREKNEKYGWLPQDGLEEVHTVDTGNG